MTAQVIQWVFFSTSPDSGSVSSQCQWLPFRCFLEGSPQTIIPPWRWVLHHCPTRTVSSRTADISYHSQPHGWVQTLGRPSVSKQWINSPVTGIKSNAVFLSGFRLNKKEKSERGEQESFLFFTRPGNWEYSPAWVGERVRSLAEHLYLRGHPSQPITDNLDAYSNSFVADGSKPSWSTQSGYPSFLTEIGVSWGRDTLRHFAVRVHTC